MKKRKGSIALCLLILFSMLLTLGAALLFYLSHTAAEAYLYRQGLLSTYAAESGANWAIGYVEAGNQDAASAVLSVNDRTVTVKVTKETDTAEGVITSAAVDSEGGNRRSLRLTYTSEEIEGGRQVTVTNITSGV